MNYAIEIELDLGDLGVKDALLSGVITRDEDGFNCDPNDLTIQMMNHKDEYINLTKEFSWDERQAWAEHLCCEYYDNVIWPNSCPA